MKYSLKQFQTLLPELNWSAAELAEKLSLIGHETVAVDSDQLDVTLTANRKDCQDFNYLVFDLVGVYQLPVKKDLISFGHSAFIAVTVADVNKLLGSRCTPADFQQLERLGFKVTNSGVEPPDFRDVATKADVAEEIFRLIGHEKLTIEGLSKAEAPPSPEYQHQLAVKLALHQAGITETLSSSFSAQGQLRLKNPFSATEPFLRPHLLDGLLRTLARNPFLKRGSFFELGSVFNPKETTVVAIILAGYKDPAGLQKKIAAALGQPLTFEAVDHREAEQFDVKQGRLVWVQMAIETLQPKPLEKHVFSNQPLPVFQPISKYPPLVRDVTLEKESLDIEELRSKTKAILPELLLAEIVDTYQAPAASKTSFTVRFIFQKMAASFTQSEIEEIDTRLNDFLK